MNRTNALLHGCLVLLTATTSCAYGVSDLPGVSLGSSDGGVPVVDGGDVDTQPSEPTGNNPDPDDAGSSIHADAGAGNASGGSIDDDAGSNADAGQKSPPAGPSDAGSPVPTTCAEANQKYGCCVGDSVYYCNGTTSVTQRACTSGKVCGWVSGSSYYDCVASPGSADPSGTHPMQCQ